MKRVALLVQYDGSHFSGWQRQKNATTVQEILEKANERYGDRKGGYTRIVRTVSRKGDNAEMAIIELV